MFAIESQDWRAAAHVHLNEYDDGWDRELTLLAHAASAGHLRDRALTNDTLQATEDLVKKQMRGGRYPFGNPRSGIFG
jgi:hypothetical protein